MKGMGQWFEASRYGFNIMAGMHRISLPFHHKRSGRCVDVKGNFASFKLGCDFFPKNQDYYYNYYYFALDPFSMCANKKLQFFC